MSCAYSEPGFPLNLTLQTGDRVAGLNEKGECVFPSKMVILKDVYCQKGMKQLAYSKDSMSIKWGRNADPL